MYIFLDSNIFYNNWHLKSGDFKFLFNFTENTRGTLLMSELVCEEVENIRNRELANIIDTLSSELKKVKKYNLTVQEYSFEPLNEEYNFKYIIENRAWSVKYVPYDKIQHSKVVKRALKNTKPFQEAEKGYRDTLIWLSFIDFLKSNKITDEVVFISNNKSDFYSKDEMEFHSDLKKDIEDSQITCKITPYDSLYKFILTRVDKERNAYSHSELEKYFDPLEGSLEDELDIYINQLSTHSFKELLSNARSVSFPFIDTLSHFSFEIIEGVEDPEILSHYRISKNIIYVGYRFNLRLCEIEFAISSHYYLQHQLDINKYYQNISTDEDETSFYSYLRVYLDVSFTYNIEDDAIEGLSVESIDFKNR